MIPDHFRIDRAGEVLERTPGLKKIAIRKLPEGGTFEEQLTPELAEQLCLDDAQLEELHRLAGRCEEVYGPGARHRVGVRGRAALPAPVPRDHARGRPGRHSRRAQPVDVVQQRPPLRRARPQGGRLRSPHCSRSGRSPRARR